MNRRSAIKLFLRRGSRARRPGLRRGPVRARPGNRAQHARRREDTLVPEKTPPQTPCLSPVAGPSRRRIPLPRTAAFTPRPGNPGRRRRQKDEPHRPPPRPALAPPRRAPRDQIPGRPRRAHGVVCGGAARLLGGHVPRGAPVLGPGRRAGRHRRAVRGRRDPGRHPRAVAQSVHGEHCKGPAARDAGQPADAGADFRGLQAAPRGAPSQPRPSGAGRRHPFAVGDRPRRHIPPPQSPLAPPQHAHPPSPEPL